MMKIKLALDVGIQLIHKNGENKKDEKNPENNKNNNDNEEKESDKINDHDCQLW